ncbi:MAG: hypothetical protein J2P52_05450 [Blastocatellia bacterium]|nr:hypothetical protein [Blastocatellia bacterium]
MEEFGKDWAAMLRLAENLCAKDYVQFFPASASIDMLVIGDENDAITIAGMDKSVRIRFWENGARNVENHVCEYFEAEKLIDALALRLSHKPQFFRAYAPQADESTYSG